MFINFKKEVHQFEKKNTKLKIFTEFEKKFIDFKKLMIFSKNSCNLEQKCSDRLEKKNKKEKRARI